MTDRNAEEQSDWARGGEDVDPEFPQLWGVLTVDGVDIPCYGLSETVLSTLEGKLTVGPYNKDSDQLMSSWLYENPSGGGFLDEHIEGGTDQQFASSSCWTLNAQQITQGPYRFSVASNFLTSDNVVPHCVFNGYFYYSCGRYLVRIENTGDIGAPLYTGSSLKATLSAPATAPGVLFNGRLWIPTGTGIDEIDTSHTIISSHATHGAISIEKWDKRLYALRSNGDLDYIDATGLWTSATPDRQIPTDQTPVELARFWDRVGRLTLYILTNSQIWIYDATSNTILPAIEEEWPRNTTNSFKSWHDDALFISLGMGVSRHSRDGIVTSVGMDRISGANESIAIYRMPDDLESYVINDTTGSYNLLLAGIAPYRNQDDFFLPQTGTGRLMAYNDSGWHQIMEIPSASNGSYKPIVVVADVPNIGYLALVGGRKNIVYGGAISNINFIRLPINKHGPLQNVVNTVAQFEPNGDFYTGWFDAGMTGWDKSASHLEVMLDHPTPVDTDVVTRTFTAYYRTEDDPDTWVLVGSTIVPGKTIFPFDPDGDGFAEGFGWNKIEFWFHWETTGDEAFHRNPLVLKYFNFKFLKLPLPGSSWRCSVDLTAEMTSLGLGPKQVGDWLIERTTAPTFSKLVIEGETRRMKVSQIQFMKDTGPELGRLATLSMIEVPIQNVSG